tara:strand:- start:326 stop:787 length:462 start_codon:yes stop_codon:yes gene_type:complete
MELNLLSGILPMDQIKLDNLYKNSIILDHCRNPRNYLPISKIDFSGSAVNPFCGDEIHFNLKLNDQTIIEEVAFEGDGCAINLASGSIISEHIKGMSIESVGKFTETFRLDMQTNHLKSFDCKSEIFVLYDVRSFPIRIKCALLSVSALENLH